MFIGRRKRGVQALIYRCVLIHANSRDAATRRVAVLFSNTPQNEVGMYIFFEKSYSFCQVKEHLRTATRNNRIRRRYSVGRRINWRFYENSYVSFDRLYI